MGVVIISPEAFEPVFIVQQSAAYQILGRFKRPLHSCNRIAVLLL
jgi:hypothetical protein